MEIEELPLYIKVDEEDDKPIITMQMKAAKAYLKNAGIKAEQLKEDQDDYELYKMAICMLVGHWYENRSTVVVGSISKELEHSLTSIIIQLRS